MQQGQSWVKLIVPAVSRRGIFSFAAFAAEMGYDAGNSGRARTGTDKQDVVTRERRACRSSKRKIPNVPVPMVWFTKSGSGRRSAHFHRKPQRSSSLECPSAGIGGKA